MKSVLLALILAPGAAWAWSTDPPPAALPEGASFGTYGVNFGAYAVTFGSASLSAEVMALAAAPQPPDLPGPRAPAEAQVPPPAAPPEAPELAAEAGGGAGGVLRSGPPPAALPEGASFSSYGVNFASYGINFGSYGVRFGTAKPSPEMLALMAPPEPEPEPLAEGLEVTEEAGGVRYTLSADVLFDFDSEALRPASREALVALSNDVRRRFENPVIVVEGHTDAKGSDAYNEALSERRAASVAAFLSGEEGFPPTAIETLGLGESRPAAPNETPEGQDDPEGRQLNRRVELLVRPAE